MVAYPFVNYTYVYDDSYGTGVILGVLVVVVVSAIILFLLSIEKKGKK